MSCSCFRRATEVVWRQLWRTAAVVCILAIAGGNTNPNRHGFVSLGILHAEASIAETTFSIPGQILDAKIPDKQQQEQQLWLYEGALYDPLDGREVAKVRGLELVRPLEDTSHLAIDALLKHPNATYEDSKTVWSQKIFCYTTTKDTSVTTKPKTETEATTVLDPREQPLPHTVTAQEESILNSVRVRPRSPRKEVPMDQAVAVYETATTFVSRRNPKKDKGNNKNVEVLVHSEWPNGQTVWGEAPLGGNNDNNNNIKNIDFTVFAKLRNKNSPLYAPDLIADEKATTTTTTTKSGDVIVSPKRAAIVQFGSSTGTMETKHKFGARETYSYRNIPNAAANNKKKKTNRPNVWFSSLPWNNRASRSTSANSNNEAASGPTLYYTRYGEGPPFYAPGRMCMLELRGRPVKSLGEVGPLLRGLILGDHGNNSISNGNTNGAPPPIANFHWKEQAEEEKEGDATMGKQKPGGRTTSNLIDRSSSISIQTAWNLREKQQQQQQQQHNSIQYSRTSNNQLLQQKQRRSRTKQQPLVLKLVVADDDPTIAIDGKRNWKALLKRERKRTEAIWDRIKASTAMESRS